MSERPKTIQIYLPQGDPQGIRMAEITTRIMQAVEVPRNLLGDFLQMPESGQVALYFLIGGSDTGQPMVYIGQTGDLRTRLRDHQNKRNFWERVLVVVSRTNSLTQTHALFLEWYCLNASRQAGRYADQNGNSGSKPHTPAPLEADCLEMYDTIKVILATLGYPLFDPLVRTEAASPESEVFLCRRSGADGRGQYTSEGFVVLKGSTGRLQMVPSAAGTFAETRRQELLAAGVIRNDGDKIIFEKDCLFRTPSGAVSTLIGAPANGWDEWVDGQGNSLDTRIRNTGESD